MCGDLAAEACVGEESSDYAADEVVAGDPVVGAADELGEGWVVVDDHVLVVALGGLDEVVGDVVKEVGPERTVDELEDVEDLEVAAAHARDLAGERLCLVDVCVSVV